MVVDGARQEAFEPARWTAASDRVLQLQPNRGGGRHAPRLALLDTPCRLLDGYLDPSPHGPSADVRPKHGRPGSRQLEECAD